MKPRLENKEAFQKILNHYAISDEGKALLREIELALFVSVTSAGRNTIIKELTKTGVYEFIVSDTTRPPRENNGVMEQNGVEYYFRSEGDFLEDLQRGKFLEAEFIHGQQVSGISLRELKKAAEHGKIAVNEVDNEGILNVVRVKPDTHAIMVLPPSFDEWMRRLQRRGHMSTEEIRSRLITAERILEDAQTRAFYKFVINDDLNEAVQVVRRIVEDGHYTDEQHEQGLECAWELLGQVKHQLSS